MSKSEPAGCLFLDDSPEEIKTKIMRATTDSGSEIKFDLEAKPGVSNLILIYATLSGASVPTLEKKYAGTNYSRFKSDLAQAVIAHFDPFRKRKKELLKKGAFVRRTLEAGSKKAGLIAARTLEAAKKKIGIAL